MMRSVAIIGATGEIGSTCVGRLLRHNWNVIAIGRRADGLAELGMRFGAEATRFQGHVVDYSEPEAADAQLQAVAADVSVLGGLIMAVGQSGSAWPDLDLERWAHTMTVNAASFLITLKAFESALSAAEGSVVTISSVAAREGYHKLDYAASKAAVEAMSRSAAILMAPKKIRVNCIAPGPVEGRAISSWSSQRRAGMLDRTARGCFAVGEDIAGVAEFLLSDVSRHMTGAVLVVDGGLSCRIGI